MRAMQNACTRSAIRKIVLGYVRMVKEQWIILEEDHMAESSIWKESVEENTIQSICRMFIKFFVLF